MTTVHQQGMRILIINIHGLLRGNGLEIGRDADNGGQTRYVYEVAEELSRSPEVNHVDIFTRRIIDDQLSEDYSVPLEMINDKLTIHRIAFGGKKYRMKEQLWGHLDEFVANSINHLRAHHIVPDWIHSHYGDAGYAAVEISRMLKIPFSHTGHSLGRAKMSKIRSLGLTAEEAEKKFKFSQRIKAEEQTLAKSSFIVTSTSQEIESYKEYENFNEGNFKVIAPGINIEKFAPYYLQLQSNVDLSEAEEMQRKYWVGEYIEKFLSQPQKPVILALSRPDRRKNLHTLLEVFGKDKELQSLANLVIFAGIRKDIEHLPPADRDVLIEMLLLMDKYDLYGKLAIPKKHDVENEVATIYRYCAEKRGVFVNLALQENFGLTIIEAGSTGLPVVATKNGGPSEILPLCKNGILVDPENFTEIKKAIINIITDENKWKTFSNNGTLNVKKYYSWGRHVKDYLGHIKSAMEKYDTIEKSFDETRLQKMNRLFASDIDGTLILKEEGHPGLVELRRLLAERSTDLAFALASGRSKSLITEAIQEFDLPRPDFLIAAVGSEIYYNGKRTFHKDKAWSNYLDWRWDRKSIYNNLKSIGWLELQEEEGQNAHKVSFYYDPAKFDMDQLRQMLLKHWPNLSVIPSHDKFLDILPRRASKGKALSYICKKWAIPRTKVVTAGDSGNDLDMLTSGVKGIIVGNRASELEVLRPQKNLYLAQGYAAEGIIEGFKHFGWLKNDK
ncbi:MAG: HAD-IIB family hydrolase [Saprospiraceae bacterium]|nr:HAD-IIB family hydrolase [Saprospiraceae bacterium]